MLKLLGILDHELKLKVGLPVMLLRNINQGAGLCNGIRMTITQLGHKVNNYRNKYWGQSIHIKNYNESKRQKVVFHIGKKQFPLLVCFAMTINQNQG
jgi:hypothetical protein